MNKINKLDSIRAGLVCISAMLASQWALGQTIDQVLLAKHNSLRELHQSTSPLTLDANPESSGASLVL